MREIWKPHYEEKPIYVLNRILDKKLPDTDEAFRVTNTLLYARALALDAEHDGRHALWGYIDDDISLYVRENLHHLKTLQRQDERDKLTNLYDIFDESKPIKDFSFIAKARELTKLKPYDTEPRMAYIAAMELSLAAYERLQEEGSEDEKTYVVRHIGDIACSSGNNGEPAA